MDFRIKSMNKKKFALSEFFVHETKKHSLIKYIALVIVVIIYFVFISIKLGTKDGILTTILTWSFFVFCTPIADAGFLLAFPVRILAGIKMAYTQIFSFLLAFVINLFAFFYFPAIYGKTIILDLFYRILSQPYPYWGIILLSLLGTLLSIYFADELIDVSSHTQRKKYHKHLNKYQIIIFIFLIGITIVLYNLLLKQLGVNIPL